MIWGFVGYLGLCRSRGSGVGLRDRGFRVDNGASDGVFVFCRYGFSYSVRPLSFTILGYRITVPYYKGVYFRGPLLRKPAYFEQPEWTEGFFRRVGASGGGGGLSGRGD